MCSFQARRNLGRGRPFVVIDFFRKPRLRKFSEVLYDVTQSAHSSAGAALGIFYWGSPDFTYFVIKYLL